MKAKLIQPAETGRFYHEKEMIKFYATVARTRQGMEQVVKAYIFRSKTGGTIYATLFAKNPNENIYVRGGGRATGGGYNMWTAAMNDAIYKAGFRLFTDEGNPTHIDSASEHRLKEALAALTVALGYKGQITTIDS